VKSELAAFRILFLKNVYLLNTISILQLKEIRNSGDKSTYVSLMLFVFGIFVAYQQLSV
jgi:hypothetical protein